MDMETRFENRPTWREYQSRLKRRESGNRPLSRFRWSVYSLVVAIGLVIGLTIHFNKTDAHDGGDIGPEPAPVKHPIRDIAAAAIGKQDIRAWLPSGSVINLENKSFAVQVNRDFYQIDTSLDPSLQAHLLEKVRGSKAELIGLVALDPDTGKVLAMVGNDDDKSSPNPCLDDPFPAASIFKIITAAAAIEECGFNPETQMTFSGGKYTLYKSQLKKKVGRYASTVSFRDSFAQSINPVFGRIGVQRLGRESLEKYGMAFGFNRDIDFEVAMKPSCLEVPEESYRLAEIACGFNRSTTLTPLHGALIAAAVLNGGRLPEPTMIEQVMDGRGHTLYKGRPAVMGEAISAKASEYLRTLMMQTISAGTCRKAFRGAAKDRVLSRLVIGGKSGSIDNRDHSRRIDWFVGFAGEKNGTGKIVVAVVVGHGEYIGVRASEFARYAFADYFKEYFAAAAAKRSPDG
jgi:penicillin-binding protein A